jgi:hypothetical protein
MGPPLRKVVLTTHIATSVGWLGAVATSLAVAVAGLASTNAQMVRGAYLILEPVGWYVLLPCGVGSLLTGLLQAVGTAWGLFRHHWVLLKFELNLLAILVLLLYMQTLDYLAEAAALAPVSGALQNVKSPSPVVHAAGALLLLLVALTLSVYKPRGMTRYGRRRQSERRSSEQHRRR